MAPKAADKKASEKKPSGAKASDDASAQKKMRKPKKAVRDRFESFIVKLLKKSHPDAGLSKAAALTADKFTRDLLHRIAGEAGRVTKFSKRTKMASKHVLAAAELVLPQAIGQEAASFAAKAVTKFTNASPAAEAS